MRLDITEIFVSNAAIVGIGLFWFNFNKTVFNAVRDIIVNTYNEMLDDEVFEEEEEEHEVDEEQDLLLRLGEGKDLEEEKIRTIVKDLLNN